MLIDVDFGKIIDRLEQYSPLSPAIRKSLILLLTPVSLEKGGVILKAGKKIDRLWFLVSGFAKEIAHGEKAKRVSWFYCPGDFMNSYPSFFNQLPAFRDIEMLSSGIVVEISCRDLITLRQQYEELAIVIDLARDDCETQRAKYASSMYSLNARERFEQLYAEHPVLFNVAKHKDITSFLGIKADSFSRFYKG